jgi:hypothetical protein
MQTLCTRKLPPIMVRGMWLTLSLVALLFVVHAAVAAGDPSGASTGGVADITAAQAGKPTLDEIAATVGHNKIAINFVWTLFTGFLVMFINLVAYESQGSVMRAV